MNKKILIIIFWIMLWSLAAILVNNSLLLPAPWTVAMSLFTLMTTGQFYLAVLMTVVRVILGFILAMVIGSLFAVLSYRFNIFNEFIKPVIDLLKAVPVACFIIMVLVWFKADRAVIVTSILVIMPIVYSNIYEGLSSMDKQLLEIAGLYKVSLKDRIRFLYLKSLKPFIDTTVSVCLGTGYKSLIAAEIIALPALSIGKGIYNSKIYLETSNLFAYAIVIVLISYLSERMIRRMIGHD
jgi:NitT/TauT family transport system permease protein